VRRLKTLEKNSNYEILLKKQGVIKITMVSDKTIRIFVRTSPVRDTGC